MKTECIYASNNDPDGTSFSNYNAANMPVKASQPNTYSGLAQHHTMKTTYRPTRVTTHICAFDMPLIVKAQILFHINFYASLYMIISDTFFAPQVLMVHSSPPSVREPHCVSHSRTTCPQRQVRSSPEFITRLYLVPGLTIKCGSYRSQLRNSYDCHVGTQQKITTKQNPGAIFSGMVYSQCFKKFVNYSNTVTGRTQRHDTTNVTFITKQAR